MDVSPQASPGPSGATGIPRPSSTSRIPRRGSIRDAQPAASDMTDCLLDHSPIAVNSCLRDAGNYAGQLCSPNKALQQAASCAESALSGKIPAWAGENAASEDTWLAVVEDLFSLDADLAARKAHALDAKVTRTEAGGTERLKVRELSTIAKAARKCLKQLDERESFIKAGVLARLRELAQNAEARSGMTLHARHCMLHAWMHRRAFEHTCSASAGLRSLQACMICIVNSLLPFCQRASAMRAS